MTKLFEKSFNNLFLFDIKKRRDIIKINIRIHIRIREY